MNASAGRYIVDAATCRTDERPRQARGGRHTMGPTSRDPVRSGSGGVTANGLPEVLQRPVWMWRSLLPASELWIKPRRRA